MPQMKSQIQINILHHLEYSSDYTGGSTRYPTFSIAYLVYSTSQETNGINDWSNSPLAQRVTPSHLAQSAGHGFESNFERFFCRSSYACVSKNVLSPLFPTYWNEAGRSTSQRLCRSEGEGESYTARLIDLLHIFTIPYRSKRLISQEISLVAINPMCLVSANKHARRRRW